MYYDDIEICQTEPPLAISAIITGPSPKHTKHPAPQNSKHLGNPPLVI